MEKTVGGIYYIRIGDFVMSENKRFNLAFYDNYDGTFSIQDTLYLEENKHLHSLDEIVDLLNEQHEDIIFKIGLIDSLQGAIGELKDDLNSLYEENEQLKKELSFWKKQAKHCPMRSCNKEVD